LTNVNFENADLSGANFWETTLIGANLSGARLTGATLSDVTCDNRTVLPDGMYWSVDTDWTLFTDADDA